ncbi:hypothetical protein A3Q56_02751 [Intoshia linei]|uniref:glutathione-specific gamma-glutamylcyclotransferase n=1 Tax=Intoshia linei TaxID=1819745 RepID=A0A177B734_9BILA|nr:hypothetical protein A3Q56_02751 [Intoshia linei]
MWIFTYGLFVWQINFEYKDSVIGFVPEHQRSFSLKSKARWGTENEPGLVLNIEKNKNENVYGVAYNLDKEAILKMDEIEGDPYEKYLVKFVPNDSKYNNIKCFAYFCKTNIPLYVGISDIDNQALIISKSKGSQGNNYEYVFNLRDKMMEINLPVDQYLESLYQKL